MSTSMNSKRIGAPVRQRPAGPGILPAHRPLLHWLSAAQVMKV